MSAAPSSLLAGAVDLHVHPSPSPYPRRVDPIGAAEAAAAAGMRAIVLKSHHGDTAVVIDALAERGLSEVGVEVYGGVVLNSQVGGINPHAVSLSLAMGGRIVWMPTISSPAHIGAGAHFPTASVRLIQERPIDVWGADGRLAPQVHDVLRLVAEADVVLASGHIPADSILATFEAARAHGVRRLLVNHPNFIVGVDGEAARRLAQLGAYIEHEVSMYDEASSFHAFPLRTLEEWIELVGVERTILASDLGQAGNPLPPESLERIATRLVRNGLVRDRAADLLAGNPARLLGI
ncbi:MAG: DUF6282 family protein [Solirubrobacteraceae bacterium]